MTNDLDMLSEAKFTKYGDFDIAIRTSTHPRGFALEEITAIFEVFKEGSSRAIGQSEGAHATPELAAADALRVAKHVIFEQCDGPDPGEE